MARPLRIEFAGAIYHVTSRGNGRQQIFLDDNDNCEFLETLGKTIERFRWTCHAFCLMVNHYHLMIETSEANLSKGMHRLNASFCQAHNKRHDKVGHLLQGRFKSIVVDRESYLLELARYVVLNPVRAGMVARPEDWPWSSYRATVGLPVSVAFASSVAVSSSVSSSVASPAASALSAPPVGSASVDSVSGSASSLSSSASVDSASVGSDSGSASSLSSSASVYSVSASAPPALSSPPVSSPSASASSPRPSASSAISAPSSWLTTTWLLSQFGPDEASARQRYCDFVSAGIGGQDSPWSKLQSQLFLGKAAFIDQLKDSIPEKKSVQEIPKLQRFANRPPLTEIFGDWKTKRKRDTAIVAGYNTYGYEQKEIANFLGVHYTTVCRVIRRHDEKC